MRAGMAGQAALCSFAGARPGRATTLASKAAATGARIGARMPHGVSCRPMKGFVLGLLVAALAFAGYLYWNGRQGLHRDQGHLRGPADAGAPAKKKRRRARGALRVAHNPPAARGEPEP